jgi:hypothetical protein
VIIHSTQFMIKDNLSHLVPRLFLLWLLGRIHNSCAILRAPLYVWHCTGRAKHQAAAVWTHIAEPYLLEMASSYALSSTNIWHCIDHRTPSYLPQHNSSSHVFTWHSICLWYSPPWCKACKWVVSTNCTCLNEACDEGDLSGSKLGWFCNTVHCM